MTSTCAILIFCGIFCFVTGRGHGHANSPGRVAFMNTKDKCLKEHSTVNENDVRKVFRNENNANEDVDDEIKCFFKCFTTEMGLMDEKGNIVIPKDKDEKSHMYQAFTACKDIQGIDDCDKAYKFQKCLNENKPPRADSQHKHNHHQ